MRQKILILGILILCAGSAVLSAQIGTTKVQSDSLIEQMLADAKLKYTVDSEGDFKLYTQMAGNRIQAVWIISKTQSIGPISIRQIWSIGYASDAPLPEPILTELLEQNSRVKLGAWQVRRMGGKYVAVFSVQVSADIDRISLMLVLSTVASTADDFEKALSGKDEY